MLDGGNMDTQTTTETKKNSTGEMSIMGAEGDTKVIWDKANPDEVDNARETFDRFKKKKYLAFSVKADGEKGQQISEFSPDAERIIFCPPLAPG